jgi:hypothetical protein
MSKVLKYTSDASAHTECVGSPLGLQVTASTRMSVTLMRVMSSKPALRRRAIVARKTNEPAGVSDAIRSCCKASEAPIPVVDDTDSCAFPDLDRLARVVSIDGGVVWSSFQTIHNASNA